MPVTDFGVLALAHALGDPRDVAATAADHVDDPDRVLLWGYRGYHRAPEGTTSTALAARAAEKALAKAGVDPRDLDLVVVADSSVPEYLLWDTSAAVARAIGAGTTPTLLLGQGCASGVTAFQQIAGTFATRTDAETILLVAVNQVSEAHTNRMRFNTLLGSDGAAAAVLRRGHGRLRWLATEQLTDPAYADFYRVEYGGATAPHAPDGTGNLDIDPLSLVYRHFRREPEHLAKFVRTLNSRVRTVFEDACDDAGVDPGQVKRFLFLNDNQDSLADVAKAVGVPLDRTNAELAKDLGHCGGADQLICLDMLLERGELAEGDVVALAGLSIGMHWYCTLLAV
ncbi:3-oxoacyl-ACP synthase III family protein [Streptomyces naphthomycinicus]|uniref:3-oxoacyl-ACP synthase III family protein n=1 Tax=Streptomyces naphthomycinicus TaxID=2872625 RepID=UPI001CED976E|nr:3-oxoacyl-[acyl-carrier-protein] synthase III C-terminal domain-containing protein [Streptomyces sp. TML10]